MQLLVHPDSIPVCVGLASIRDARSDRRHHLPVGVPILLRRARDEDAVVAGVSHAIMLAVLLKGALTSDSCQHRPSQRCTTCRACGQGPDVPQHPYGVRLIDVREDRTVAAESPVPPPHICLIRLESPTQLSQASPVQHHRYYLASGGFDGQLSWLSEVRRRRHPATTVVDPPVLIHLTVVAEGAPIRMSWNPSPLTSPAPATAVANPSPAERSRFQSAFPPSRGPSPVESPKNTKARSYSPITTSANPSPFVSPSGTPLAGGTPVCVGGAPSAPVPTLPPSHRNASVGVAP